ncbi:MAG: sulfotransferase domain-containing protein [Methyloglobulus sp.]|nr:sulfotransferase [Methyloglobulus sp.]
MATKPDFIIIGAMKCATSSLHTQLAQQPGIFMTTPKEPSFFSDDSQYARGIGWYEALFNDAQKDDICGESSTHYTKLPHYPHCVERLSAYLPKVKLVYVMRHPLDRLVSHYIHQWSQNVINCEINQAVDQYDELTAFSCYAKQLEPYINVYGRENILPVFFEAVKAHPQRELEKIARFIGYTQPVSWQEELSLQNASNERIKHFKGYDMLVDSKLMTALRRNLIPQFVRDVIKKNLTMQKRPMLDEKHIEDLTKIFDADLQLLGNWLGTDLNCKNFVNTGLSESLGWK